MAGSAQLQWDKKTYRKKLCWKVWAVTRSAYLFKNWTQSNGPHGWVLIPERQVFKSVGTFNLREQGMEFAKEKWSHTSTVRQQQRNQHFLSFYHSHIRCLFKIVPFHLLFHFLFYSFCSPLSCSPFLNAFFGGGPFEIHTDSFLSIYLFCLKKHALIFIQSQWLGGVVLVIQW